MKATALDRRLHALEQHQTYRIVSLADLVLLMAWRQRGDPRTPRPEDVEWGPEFVDIYEKCMGRRRKKDEA